MKKSEYTVLDLETTGLSRHYHKITEIAAVKYKGRKKIGEFQTLVNPETPIPRFITKLTGIDDEMVKDAPVISKVLPEFMDFLGESIIVAHNASFDFGFLNHNAVEYLGHSLPNERLCTRKLANRLLPDLPRKRLSNLCEHFGVVNEQAHRAMADTKVTIDVFHGFLDMLEENGVKSKAGVLEFEKMSAAKCAEILSDPDGCIEKSQD